MMLKNTRKMAMMITITVIGIVIICNTLNRTDTGFEARD